MAIRDARRLFCPDGVVLTGIDWLDKYLPRAAMVFWDTNPLGAAII